MPASPFRDACCSITANDSADARHYGQASPCCLAARTSGEAPHIRKPARRMPIVYGYRNDRGRCLSTASYVVITGSRSPFNGNRSTSFEQIRDGRSTTILSVSSN